MAPGTSCYNEQKYLKGLAYGLSSCFGDIRSLIAIVMSAALER